MKPQRTWVEVNSDSTAWVFFDQHGKPIVRTAVVQWMHHQRIKMGVVPQNLTNGDIFRYCEIVYVNNRVFYRFSSPRLAMLFKLVWT